MGSGCSSPLKRFGGGGRRAKQQQQRDRRESSSPANYQAQECRNQDNQRRHEEQLSSGAEQVASAHEHHQHQLTSSASLIAAPAAAAAAALNTGTKSPMLMDYEITIQSEFNDDHPSTASYYTDVRNNNDDTRISGISGSLDPKSSSSITRTDATAASLLPLNMRPPAATATPTSASLATTHDRHLLVSPAPSSTCYSPSPAVNSTSASSPLAADLNALMALFRTLTLGDLQPANTPQTSNHLQSTTTTTSQQLLQTRHDLVNSVSVFLFISDNFQIPPATAEKSPQPMAASIEALAHHIETNLRLLAHEHLFNLKFFNISSDHVAQYFQVSNLTDVCFKVMEKELADNGQRIVVIILSSVSMGGDSKDRSAEERSAAQLQRKQLPSTIETQTFSNLLANLPETPPDAKDLIKKWYTKNRVSYHLNPIYQVYPNILNGSREAHESAWNQWVSESNSIKQMIKRVQDSKPELVTDINLFSLFECCLDFVLQNSSLQKKTLLIRNLTQLPAVDANSTSMNNTSSTNQINIALAKDTSLNELSKLLADPNKLTLKQTKDFTDTSKTLASWINENFGKFLEGILENQIVNGKQVPCFVERNLFIELTSQRQQLQHYLENTSENFLVKCNNFYSNQISPTIDDMISILAPDSSPSDRDGSINYESSFSGLQPASSHLIFISGHKGCGKSTLFSQIIKLTAQDYCDKAQLIYRFAGISQGSLNTDRLLRSICEQFCQTQGENIIAASYVYSSRKQIMTAINKINKNQACIIFLDGLDDLIQSDDSEIDWLLELGAGARVRIFIMLEATSNLYKKVLGSYSDATHISLDSPSINEWAQMLSSTARSNRFNSTGNLFDEIRRIDTGDSKDAPLSYNDVNDIMHMCQIRRLNNEVYYLELSSKMLLNSPIQNMKNVHQNILNHLLYLMTPYELASFIIIMDSSRNGLSESDILGIMSMIAQSSKADWKFSSLLLDYLKLQMRPWLIYMINDKVVKININKHFTSRAINFFSNTLNMNIQAEVRGYLLDYFSRNQGKTKSSKTSSSKGELILNELKENPNFQERLILATQASETINLLLKTAPTKAKDQILNKSSFFSRFFYGFTPEEFIEDYKTLRETLGRKSSTSEDLQTMVNYIRQSIYPLRYDGNQIYSQIYCRSFDSVLKGGKSLKSKKFNELISTASCPPMRNLLPISEASVNSFIKTRVGQLISSTSNNQLPVTSSLSTNAPSTTKAQSSAITSRPTSSQQPPSQVPPTRQKIYTIKDNHRYVIVIYPDRGTLSVWDIYEERAARTITNIDQPRDLRMIDQKRAVILCNRELKVYDLDSGLMLTKLKGVMNQKMPYFRVYEENYVVALARNRMYVNMFNISTGELETTFKVGEDRFLNSLLVSAEGGICVCGDETQKPFPLLVWNLNERRLMYDLRLDKHEFITRMSAISDDGHFVVSVCKQLGDTQDSSLEKFSRLSPNFLVIYDLNSGTLFKKWKPGLDSCAVAISMAPDKSRKVINTVTDNSILIWDMATSSKRHTLIGHSAPVDVIKVQNNRLFSMDSTCLDQSLRIWDMDEGYCLSVFSPDAPVSCCQMSIRGDALVCGFTAETRLSTLVMCKNETVNDVVKRNKRRKSSKSLYCFDDPASRKSSQ